MLHKQDLGSMQRHDVDDFVVKSVDRDGMKPPRIRRTAYTSLS
jgi:hypothetical protein